MMIIGKKYSSGLWNGSPYRSYNIIINAGWDSSKLNSYKHPRRMIIARTVSGIPAWTAPDNLISFSQAGFTLSSAGNWPKFIGTFRIHYMRL